MCTKYRARDREGYTFDEEVFACPTKTTATATAIKYAIIIIHIKRLAKPINLPNTSTAHY